MSDPRSDASRESKLSRRGLLYGVAAAGAAATSGSGVAALLADEERAHGSFTSGILDLDVEVLRPTAWRNSAYTASIGVHETKTAEFELTVDSNPAYIWLLTPCPRCDPIESQLTVHVEVTRSGSDPTVRFDGTLRSFRDTFATGGLLSTDALSTDETWTVSLSWTVLAPVDDVTFDFDFRAVQARNLETPEEYAFGRPDCGDCQDEEHDECGNGISFAAFCSDEEIVESDISFETKECGDSGREATLEVTAAPAHLDEVLLKSATNLDVFEYNGQSTPFSVTTGGSSEDLSFVASYDQQGNEYPESGDPPRRNSDPCPGKYWVKFDIGGGNRDTQNNQSGPDHGQSGESEGKR